AHQVVGDAQRNRELPFETVVSAVQTVRDSSRNPLFQCGVQVFDPENGASQPQFDGITVETVPASTGYHPVDTSIFGIATPDRLDLVLNYATDILDRPRSERMLGHFQRLLMAGVDDQSQHLSMLPMLTDAELNDVLEAWQGAKKPWRREVIHKLI